MAYEFDRAHYRIEYPPKARPRFTDPAGHVWPVDDCSERGVRLHVLPEPGETLALPAVGARVRGRLEFQTGASADVEGVVVRVSDDRVAVRLDGEGVPLPIIWAEQRFLRARYAVVGPRRPPD